MMTDQDGLPTPRRYLAIAGVSLGITLAVGLVVDDAIVMLENIVRHVEDGMAPFDAAVRGVNDRVRDASGTEVAPLRRMSSAVST